MAGSIILYSFNRKYCHLFGIYPPESTQSGSTINWRNRIIIISLVPFILSSAAFLFCEAKTLFEYGISFMSASGSFCFMCIYLAMITQMKNIWPFIENCERFIEKREDAIIVYREIIKKIERICELVGIAMIATVLFTTLPFLFYSLINYYIFDLGEESFILFFQTTLPFDWKTPLGYFVAWFIESVGIAASGLVGIMLLDVFFGSCSLFIVMAVDVTKDLAAFNQDVKANGNHPELMERFCDIIQLFVSKMDPNAKLLETIGLIIMGLWVFGVLFINGELGERVTYHFDNFRKELERCDWHTLPMGMQRMYLIFLSDTQQPKNITCFANILISRETFKQTLNNGYSYFNTLRQFEI